MVDLATQLDSGLPFPGAETGAFRPIEDVASTLGGLALDATPIIGDVRNVQAGVEAAQTGDKLGMGLAVLGAIPGVGLLAKGARAAKSVFRAADIPGAVKRAIPLEDEALKLGDDLRSMGAQDSEIAGIEALVSMGMRKAEVANDPAFADAAETLMETSKAIADGNVLKFGGELSQRTMDKMDEAVRTLKSNAVPSTKTRGNVFETRHTVQRVPDPRSGRPIEEFRDSATFPHAKAKGFVNDLEVLFDNAFVPTSGRGDNEFQMNFMINGTQAIEDVAGDVAKSDVLKVFGTVFDSAERFIKRRQPDKLKFSTPVPGLKKVYSRMGPRLAKETGYTFKIEETASVGTFFTLTRQ